MKRLSKRFLSIALALIMLMVLIPQNVQAANANTIAATINKFGLVATVDSNTVKVTGDKQGASNRLELNIDTNVTVEWHATLTGTTTGIHLKGAGSRGSFLMKSGEISGESTSPIIESESYVSITIDGGLVRQAGSGSAISNTGGSSINVNGGYIHKEGIGSAISNASNTNSSINISGGTVKNSGTGQAIFSFRQVNISGVGRIIAGDGVAIEVDTLNGKIDMKGGLAFAYGNDIVGNGDLFRTRNSEDKHISTLNGATCIAWDKNKGKADYDINSSDDIYTSSGVTAHWDVQNNLSGISYENSNTGNSGFIPLDVRVNKTNVTNSGGSAEVTYAGTTIDLSTLTTLFTLDDNAGASTYTLENSDTTGTGNISDSTLTVTKAGIFKIGLTTAATDTHNVGAKVTGTLTVNKGSQAAPTGLSAVNATGDSLSDGKITGLDAGKLYEYKNAAGSAYTPVAAGSTEITGLAAGTYLVRLRASDLYNAGTDASVTVGVSKANVTNEGHDITVVYAGSGFDLATIEDTANNPLFTIDSNAGDPTFTIEVEGTTGTGSISGSTLTVTKAGIFKIGLTTAATDTHNAGAKVTGTLTVNKGSQAAPTGLSAVDASDYGLSDGKITGLAVNTDYEYKKDGGGYTSVSSNAAGETTGLAAGTYDVRLPETDLYSASEDSVEVVINQPAPPVYSISLSPSTVSFDAIKQGYSPVTPIEITIENTSNRSLSLLDLAFTGTESSSFEITSPGNNITDLAVGGTATVSVRPVAGLTAGNYSASFAVSNSTLNISESVPVNFTVLPLSSDKDIISVISPSFVSISGTTVSALVDNSEDSLTVDLTVSDLATWELFSDAACTHEISDKTMTLSVGLNTAYIQVTAEDGSSKIYTLEITRMNVPPVNSPPVILNVSVIPGISNASLNVEATGVALPLSYQWQVKGSWINIPGATSSEFDYKDLKPNTDYTIRVLVTDAEGRTAVSNEISFRTSAVAITGLPQSQTLIKGRSVSFTPSPSGGTWSYDESFLSMKEEGATTVFTALKSGKTEVRYQVDGSEVSIGFDIVEEKESIPLTGEHVSKLPWLLVLLAAITFLFMLLRWKKEECA